MATFKVGQEVRFARGVKPAYKNLIGKTGRIAAVPGEFCPDESFGGPFHWDCRVDLAGGWAGTNCMFSELEPATDPKADAFLEAIRKLKPLHEEPKVERQFVHSQSGG